VLTKSLRVSYKIATFVYFKVMTMTKTKLRNRTYTVS